MALFCSVNGIFWGKIDAIRGFLALFFRFHIDFQWIVSIMNGILWGLILGIIIILVLSEDDLYDDY
jgi:hypothetical protein